MKAIELIQQLIEETKQEGILAIQHKVSDFAYQKVKGKMDLLQRAVDLLETENKKALQSL